MIAKEVQYRLAHYTILFLLLSGIFATFYLLPIPYYRDIFSVLYGLIYIIWGICSHRGESYTLRLVLEYIFVGLLGSTILLVIAHTA